MPGIGVDRLTDLAQFDPRWSGWISTPQSSNVAAFAYSPATGWLDVRFGGQDGKPLSHYRYLDVPPGVFNGLVSATSKGKYMHATVKGRFGYVRLA